MFKSFLKIKKRLPRCPCRKGFSFMEILFCLCAIVAMSSGAFVIGGHIFTSGRYNAAKSDVATISTAISQYNFELGHMPATLNALTVADGQYGPWLPGGTLDDPWGNAYQLIILNAHEYVVMSNGVNGTNDRGYQNNNTDDIFIRGIN